ncbi:HipA family kinase [Neobacillus sp. GCM10023253]|uniref:HipA family kinase n=1 Tax=Neobacillus sp. GCM10023253 TaxID=3252644 RepID=UPI003610DB29
MIKPVSYQKKLQGKSNAHLITFDDGREYVVKFFQQGFERSLPNEWVAYCLGRYLGLPIPFGRIVEIPQEFSLQVPELAKMGHTQYQFASLYIPDCLDGHKVSKISSIENHQSLAGIIAFDYWLFNRDRTRMNVLFQEVASGGYKLWMIDQAEVFGSFNWIQEDVENLPADILKSATHELMSAYIEDEKLFNGYLEIIQTIPILLIEEIVELIPEEWGVTKDEKKAIVTTLVTRRKKILPKLVERFMKRKWVSDTTKRHFGNLST